MLFVLCTDDKFLRTMAVTAFWKLYCLSSTPYIHWWCCDYTQNMNEEKKYGSCLFLGSWKCQNVLAFSFHKFYKDITFFIIICSVPATVHMQQPRTLQNITGEPLLLTSVPISSSCHDKKHKYLWLWNVDCHKFIWLYIPANHSPFVRLKNMCFDFFPYYVEGCNSYNIFCGPFI